MSNWSPAKAIAQPGYVVPRSLFPTELCEIERNTLTGSPTEMSVAKAPEPALTGVAIGIPVWAVNAASRTPDSFTCESAEYNNSGFAKMRVVVTVDVTVEETTEVPIDVCVMTEVTVFGGGTAR